MYSFALFLVYSYPVSFPAFHMPMEHRTSNNTDQVLLHIGIPAALPMSSTYCSSVSLILLSLCFYFALFLVPCGFQREDCLIIQGFLLSFYPSRTASPHLASHVYFFSSFNRLFVRVVSYNLSRSIPHKGELMDLCK